MKYYKDPYDKLMETVLELSAYSHGNNF